MYPRKQGITKGEEVVEIGNQAVDGVTNSKSSGVQQANTVLSTSSGEKDKELGSTVHAGFLQSLLGSLSGTYSNVETRQGSDKKLHCDEPPLKVFMYDLPQKFNFGLFKRDPLNDSGELVWNNSEVPQMPRRAGLKNQHSVTYFLMADLWTNSELRPAKSSAVRVYDAEEADVFFVPFFSSLSFNTFGRNMRDPETKKDEALQIELVSFLEDSKWWQMSGGRDHVFCMTHPNAMRFRRDTFNQSVFILADFGRYPKNVARLSKDVIAPYFHMVPTLTDDTEEGGVETPFDRRKFLLFFQGTISRKDDGWVREGIRKVVAGETDVHFVDSRASPESFKTATDGMRNSKFCLHPAGDTPSSCRLFDAIASNCVPVIVSNKLELPFEDELDYREFAVFVSQKDATEVGYLLNLLRGYGEAAWMARWRRLKEVKHHFEYQYPLKPQDATNMIWRQVQHKVPFIRQAINRHHRLQIPDWWDKRKKR
eukprot:jgi/Mesen1/6215/ME000320S05412